MEQNNKKEIPVLRTLYDGNGVHHFENDEEYQAYIKSKPIICNACIYHHRANYNCPFGEAEGECTSCTYYEPNPTSLKDWIRRYEYKLKCRYYNWINTIFHKWEQLQHKSKYFIILPHKNNHWFRLNEPDWYPYFTFGKRLINEYEKPVKFWKVGYIKTDKGISFFDKCTGNYPNTETTHYRDAECLEDVYVSVFPQNFTDGRAFKCKKGETYRVGHVEKYGYYKICYERESDNFYVDLYGEISEKEFNKYFKITSNF